MSDRAHNPFLVSEPIPTLPEGEVLEIPLLLSGWQVSALETAAHNRGLTAGEMVRHVLRDFFTGSLTPRAGSARSDLETVKTR